MGIRQLCEVFEAQAQSVIIPLFLKQLADQEVDVRTIAASRIAAVSAVRPNKEFLEI